MNNRIIDIHSHILPELDDGARSLSESLEMARVAVESGVRIVAATPHCAGDRTEAVRGAVQLLREALEEEGIPLRILMGMEIFGTTDTARMLALGKLFTLNNSRYPLIEFDFGGSGELERRILADVILAGYVPVVAHPERYLFVQHDPEIINEWHRMGCLFQVNRGSVMGRFGQEAQMLAAELIRRGFASCVASDAHSSRIRTPWMEDVYHHLRREVAPSAAGYLLWENPRRILKNEQPLKLEPELF